MKYPAFTYEQPVEYAREHVQYVLVCSKEKNPLAYSKIKDCRLAGGRYTPPKTGELYIFVGETPKETAKLPIKNLQPTDIDDICW